MKTKEEILKKYLNDVMFRHYPSSIKLIEGAMEEYAEQQVKNCTITDVMGVSLPLDKILRLDQPYSLPEVLKRLVEAADILLHKKDYDGHGWEEIEYAYRHAKDIIKVFDGNEA